jgi:excisionase family DNA binding protein
LKLLTIAEVAAKFRVTPGTVKNWAKAGKIPVIRMSKQILRFEEEAIDAAVRELAAKK